MNKIDWSELSARQLQVLVAVLEEGSVTAAAGRLDVSQSAVSHALDRLRAITGDALFVKCGRGIAATAHAEALGSRARDLLRDLQAFTRGARFVPGDWRGTLTMAANDFQRELLLPALAARLRATAPGVKLMIVDSAVPDAEDLRGDRLQLVISPRPPDGTDIMQRKLLEDDYVIYYDPAERHAPRDRDDFLAARHATVVYGDGRRLDLDNYWISRGVTRDVAVTVPGFAAIPAFVRGTDLLAAAPAMLAATTFRDLAHAPVPVESRPLPLYAIWHARYQDDPAHRWLRARLDEVVGVSMRAF